MKKIVLEYLNANKGMRSHSDETELKLIQEAIDTLAFCGNKEPSVKEVVEEMQRISDIYSDMYTGYF